MKIAAAQTIPKDGNIKANLADHIRLATLAADKGAELIVFPEMSLTGYVMEHAKENALTAQDERLAELQRLSVDKSIMIIAGAPILIEEQLYIGAFILSPGGAAIVYTKQFLHDGEERFFSSSFDYNPAVRLGTEKVSMAICADITDPRHPENAARAGCDLYVAGIFYTPNVQEKAHPVLSGYAKQHSMNVLMANYGGPSWGLDAGGGSAFWTDDGRLVGSLDMSGEGLLIAQEMDGTWNTRTIDTK